MVLTKLILKEISQNGHIEFYELCLKIDHIKVEERLAFLCENRYVKQNKNGFMITERGKNILDFVIG